MIWFDLIWFDLIWFDLIWFDLPNLWDGIIVIQTADAVKEGHFKTMYSQH